MQIQTTNITKLLASDQHTVYIHNAIPYILSYMYMLQCTYVATSYINIIETILVNDS